MSASITKWQKRSEGSSCSHAVAPGNAGSRAAFGGLPDAPHQLTAAQCSINGIYEMDNRRRSRTSTTRAARGPSLIEQLQFRAFTLIELLVVVSIIALLAALLV